MKIGFLYPSEIPMDDLSWLVNRLFPDGEVAAHDVLTSMAEDAHTVDAVYDLGRADRLEEGVRQLRRDDVAAAMWACTAGSFTYGWQGAQEQAARLSDAFGGPASSTSLAFVTALHELGLTRVAVAATYPQDVADAFEAFLAEAGFEVLLTRGNEIHTAAEAMTLGRDDVLNIVQSANDGRADAVLMPDTALQTVRWLEELEDVAGKPVLTANQVTVWEALRLVEQPARANGLGALFAEPAASV